MCVWPRMVWTLELLHQILGHRSTRSLLDLILQFFGKDIYIRVDPDPFFTSCQISTIHKRDISETLLKLKTPLKRLFVDTIPDISPKSLTKYTSFTNICVYGREWYGHQTHQIHFQNNSLSNKL